jgi:S-DNA-T family DNA segregation ATPase FtsK/SpoIIIE
MEERYKTLAAEGVRNIEQFNRNIRLTAGEIRSDDDRQLKPLPSIVVVIDELADLMMVASSEVEESIARLAQMARAVGIHLILATQRPSVDVITGLIKANLPARISFRVSSKTDSRTILDGNGAEQLLGNGDMLYLPPASSRLIRLHGPYISEQESARLASFLRKQGEPAYDETITADEKSADTIELDKDDLYDQAARIVVETGQASISYLQRRLRVGFSRAARLVDMMEAEGLISGATGGRPREVLVKKDYFEAVDAQLR